MLPTNPKNGDTYPLDLNGTPLHLVFVEGGTFEMGSNDFDDEKPIHQVKLSSFWLGRYPVTQAQWKTVMQGENPSRFVGDNRPVERVSWEDIDKAFLPALKSEFGIIAKLPSEAQWEYAARGGKTHSPFKYAGSDVLHEVGWYYDNSHLETKPVGLKKPNGLGLYDMSGNVWEWCEDWYSDAYYKQCKQQGIALDPINTVVGSDRVIRGGSWGYGAIYCRVADRNNLAPSERLIYVGFRVCCSP